jgi:hypothetical protein
MSISLVDSTDFQLSLLEADPAGRYDIYFATNIVPVSWSDILQGVTGQTNFTLPIPAAERGFFRVARADEAVADAAGMTFYFLNSFVNTNITSAVVGGGPAVGTAILVDSTNFAGAMWIPFTSTPLVDIGTNEGMHDVWFGFKGTNGIVYWTEDTVTLDKTPPSIVITNPVFTTTSRPIIQVQGYSPEPLSSIYFDVTNAVGSVTNQQGFVIGQDFDTNNFNPVTNWFQCFDLELTNGVNKIIIHAADLAGNVTTTNVTVILDLTGDTNPPVITVTWPQDGAQISGTNFTLRGVLDDETAQITALTVDTNGATNVISGLVERSGTFWLEDLPLNPGTNVVTIIATDAAGNASVTNLTLIQSDVILSIDPVSDDQLNHSVTTVTGTVSDPSCDVWVNGVEATVDEHGNWSADNVPIMGNGTVCFDATAYPAEQSPVQASWVSEQPPTIFINQYSDAWIDDEGNNVSWGASKNYSATLDGSGHLSYQGNGTFFYHFDHFGSSEGWWDTSYNWSSDDPIGTFVKIGDDGDGSGGDFGTGCGDVFNPDPYGVPSSSMTQVLPLVCLSHYYANINYHLCGINYTRSSKTYMKLRTGGKSGVNRQHLFTIGASATEYFQPDCISWYNAPDYWINVPMSSIPRDQIRVLGKNVGNDGNLFIVLPDNATLDLGATAPGRHYMLDVGATKHKLVISANGSPLAENRVRPEANYCAGQNIGFSPHFYPDLPTGTVSTKTVQWNFTGQFVTAWTQWSGLYKGAFYYGSKDYYLDNSILTLENSHAWWTRGSNPSPEQETVTLGIMVEFNNGQNAFLKRRGLFTMYQPSIDFHQNGQAAVYIDYIGIAVALRVGKNIGSGQLTDLMSFAADVHSDLQFPGEVITTQLINRDASIDGIPFASTDGSFWLDGNETYPNSHDNVIRQQPTAPECYGQSLFSDGPGISVQLASWASIHDQFRAYFRFRPSGGDSIWITLGRVDWNWFGNAEYTGLNPLDPNSWTLTSSGVGGPNFTPTDERPQWHLTYSE